ncbi:sensor histidine kinase [Ereboglobus luteus]|uniref:histidine kinase n=1 Tax=Ereboglobus luteus TaxID=1796921 RepID=A0A2U8E014_9BACT|nr:ATP-binding protein [Ereboglobus luteus]AWI08180.1 PAS domain-containing sensor histidine kinase [Ereboglobus luteus]
MAAKTYKSLDHVLGRFDSLDPASRASLVQRLARERRLLENIFNVLKDGVILVDADGHVEYANQTAGKMLGLRDDQLGDVVLWRFVPGLRPPIIDVSEDARDDAVQAAHAMTREIELTYPESRVLRLYMVPFFSDENGGRQQYAVILGDITNEREKTEQRIADERTSSIRLLAAGVAHELGNPLNSLTIHLQLIERRLKKLKGSAKKDADALSESIGVCQEEVKRLDGIITNFLEAVHPRPPDLCETQVSEVLADVLHFQRRELEDRGITVEVEAPGDLPLVMADRNQLKQVFFNINKNAMEAMQPGGVLRVKARADDDNVYLLFGDTGAGIKQADLAKLFQPYHTTKQGGHGLGLMIVQRIMREHGGQIGIESREGAGTVVTLQFPRKDRRVRMLK